MSSDQPQNAARTGFEPAVYQRLGEIIDTYPSTKDAAMAADVSSVTLRRWRAGTTDISLTGLVALVSKAQFSLDWLLTGQGAPRPQFGHPLDEGGSAPLPLNSGLWNDIFSVVSDIAAMNAQPLALSRHHQVVHDIYNRAARFATDAERNAAITVLVVDRVAAAHEAQTGHERIEARRRTPPATPPAPDKSDPEEPV